jgi:hypothetical protein
MSCSPLLKGLTDPLEVLKVVAKNHILRYSEGSATFYPLREKGWVEYNGGHWSITKAGRAVLPEPLPKPATNPKLSLSALFSIGDS